MIRCFANRRPRAPIRMFGVVLGAALLAGSPVPSLAQDQGDAARLRKIEAEIRALQRKVFPGGNSQYFEPQIGQEQAKPATNPLPSSTALTDILARLDALESQLQSLTARSEENTNALALIDARLGRLEQGTSFSTDARSAVDPLAVSQVPNATSQRANDKENATQSNLGAMTGNASSASDPAVQAGPSAERLAAVKQIAKPQTGDAGDDEYSYGFRLWNAGFYPESRQQLSLFLENYPTHWRATYARNLIGRAFLDEGKPREAAPWFLKNYQSDKQAVRAGDSLLYLAESMIALGDQKRACIALAEFGETYPVLATGRLKDQYESDRKKVDCN